MKRSQKRSQGNQNIDKILGRADDLVRKGRFKDAEQALESNVRAQTKSHLIHCKLAAVHWMQGNLIEDAKNYQLALAINPDVADAHWFLGSICKQLGEVEQATDHCLKALTLNPSDPTRQKECGDLLKDSGRTKEAIEAYRSAVGMRPDYAEAYIQMGNAYMQLARPADAIESYKKAYAVNQEFSVLLSNLAKALRQHGQYEEAEKVFREEIKSNPLAWEAYVCLGTTLTEGGRISEAIYSFKQAIAINQSNPDLQIRIAGAYEIMAEFDKAEWHYLLALESDDQHYPAICNLACIAKGKGLESLKVYMQKAIQKKPKLLNDLTYAEAVASLGSEFCEQIFGYRLDSP